MSFEIAFLILVVAFMILSRVLKQLAKQTGEAAKPKSGWRGKLQRLLQEIQREMEAGKEQAEPEAEPTSGRGRWWEELMQPEEAGERQPDKARPAEKKPEAPYRQPAQERQRQTGEDAAFTRPASQTDWTGTRARREPDELGMPSADAAESRAPRISRQNLRQAVIWKEILGKPVALRDK